jgi:hypothetical protein
MPRNSIIFTADFARKTQIYKGAELRGIFDIDARNSAVQNADFPGH